MRPNNKNQPEVDPNAPVRVRIPKGKEIIGILAQRVGGSRMLISCMDGKTRNCKVPGRLRRGMWLREGDVVIIEPWEFDDDKGHVMYKYTKTQVEKLKQKGMIQTSEEEF
ncbi:translation initiation factor IF-1A [Candidatus Pacearchaeota archaeon]|nr:translation initiation factor IF-1A [Candidatus Pacearchaeota archaeon]|tara:strand:+ start:2855 stop:3184 length:330 start_codon:yes stop_codon:yes gene_type:complete